MSQILSKSSKAKAIKYGIPFLICVIGGSFGLKEFSQIRYQFSRNKQIKREELEELSGIELKKEEEVTLEKLYDTVKDIDIEHWEPIRLTRPWEEPKSS